ncbi:conserved Plasmodium protein, unknown function [Plasmodium berghei]|uniref:Mini-chromosome maintenance complex-binding protein, putative n=2 Tax=Plasmodium berghei TaxID=5821 RepID=A0A509ANL8_PLABA|nr:mini-chromosome maintenance complex-binding protein, putative [Plasmodium berghei ANKA]CXI55257.1 conserved Plasmodium protein, unknown function [Plasmodium berghei]SCL95134.1 conserved Plasmodium protein, unknown function [Plasmodium berghei]SCM16180.1 conserved Plasmodium protein, unknown function [Plasmodium berghei]SCM17976.1 conserved Plasmodium protein, unknown function [Plasmodium berghei]SCN26366.1 conserved Plasmodium protein, unknown function [Plasmodium berghei]|eukprot:XP_034422104.1 mini-chromosome maintenance complex-binding protein, putative [Plasmodium berghei ANKA]
MNILNQIDTFFLDYTKTKGIKKIDTDWDEGIIVNRYIELGNGISKSLNDDNKNTEQYEEKKEQKICNLTNERPSDENKKIDSRNDISETLIKEKRNNFLPNDNTVDNCVCINSFHDLNELKDATLVRWTCMVQQIISPECYLGIYKLRNKKTGEIILKSSKYRDYIDMDDNWEVIEESEKKNAIGEYYESSYGKYNDITEQANKDTSNENDKSANNWTIKTEINKMDNENKNGNNKLDQKCDEIIMGKENEEGYTQNNKKDVMFYDNYNNFTKYWNRYLFLCTNIPGSKGSWCKNLYEYTSYLSNSEFFLKNPNNYEQNDNKNSDSIGYSCKLVRTSESRLIENSDSTKNEKDNTCHNPSENHLNSNINNDISNSLLKTKQPQNETVKEEKDKEFITSQKMRCIVKIYDSNSQYNGKNAEGFLKLNDIIEIIGIFRKHQIKDYEDYQKNLNYYFSHDQNFLKYPCIHVFRYTKINIFNPINNCILFKNDLTNILESGPFNNINDLRKHLIIYISTHFSNDLLVAHYIFFYLCASYINESKLKLGKFSLSIFNLLTKNISTDKPYQHDSNSLSNDQKDLNYVKRDITKSEESLENTIRQMPNIQNVNNFNNDGKEFANNIININNMFINLIPLYRYIPLSLSKLNSDYLSSVMNNNSGELKKGKLQLANNTYIAFDECLLDVGNLNSIGIKNFHCIERLITSQELPYFFNTDITFETQNNILILSKKKSMFYNYIDISVPILQKEREPLDTCNVEKESSLTESKKIETSKNIIDNLKTTQKNDIGMDQNKSNDGENISKSISFSNDFKNTYENYKPNENELMQFRRYINYILSKNHSAKITTDIQNYITDYFVTLRQTNKSINQFILNTWICISRIFAFSDGSDEITKDHWNYIMELEEERRVRMDNLDRIYV